MVTPAPLHDAIRICLQQINRNLTEASRIAKAAEACAAAGGIAEGIEVSMEIEQLIYEASRLHDAACLMSRLSRG